MTINKRLLEELINIWGELPANPHHEVYRRLNALHGSLEMYGKQKGECKHQQKIRDILDKYDWSRWNCLLVSNGDSDRYHALEAKCEKKCGSKKTDDHKDICPFCEGDKNVANCNHSEVKPLEDCTCPDKYTLILDCPVHKDMFKECNLDDHSGCDPKPTKPTKVDFTKRTDEFKPTRLKELRAKPVGKLTPEDIFYLFDIINDL